MSRVQVRRCIAEQVEGGVEAILPATVCLMVGLGGHEPDQLVKILRGSGQDDALTSGSSLEHQSVAVGVKQPQLTQRGGYLVADGDLVHGTGERGPTASQIERRVRPAADASLVAARAAAPLDRCGWVRTEDDQPTRAPAVTRPAPARQRAHPCAAGVTGRGCPDNQTQLLAKALRRGGDVVMSRKRLR